MDKLLQMYNRLTGEERARALILAMARDDRDEVQRLNVTCPRKEYRMADAAYVDWLDAAQTVTWLAALDLGPRLVELRMARSIRGLLGLMVDHLAMGAAVAQAQTEADVVAALDKAKADRAPVLEEADKLIADLAGNVAAILAAFGRVAQERMGLDAQTLFKAFFAPILDKLQDLPDLEPDPAKVAEYAEILAELWQAQAGTE